MKTTKEQIPSVGKISLQAKDGIILPFYYEGSIRRLTAEAPLVIDAAKLPYQTRVLLERAIADDEVVAVEE